MQTATNAIFVTPIATATVGLDERHTSYTFTMSTLL
jgi:hypothetical protein